MTKFFRSEPLSKPSSFLHFQPYIQRQSSRAHSCRQLRRSVLLWDLSKKGFSLAHMPEEILSLEMRCYVDSAPVGDSSVCLSTLSVNLFIKVIQPRLRNTHTHNAQWVDKEFLKSLSTLSSANAKNQVPSFQSRFLLLQLEVEYGEEKTPFTFMVSALQMFVPTPFFPVAFPRGEPVSL